MSLIECGGLGKLNDISNFAHIRLQYSDISIHLICPDNICNWLSVLIAAIIESNYKYGKRNPIFIFTIGDVRGLAKNSGIIGHASKGDNILVFTMTKQFLSNLKQSKPEIRISKSIAYLIELIWHEIHHFKGCGTSTPTQEEVYELLDVFWDYMKEKNKVT